MNFTEAALEEKPQKVLVFGPPKTGKTELVARLVEAGYKLLWLDVESGWQTIKTRIDKKYWPQIELIRIPDTRENPAGYNTVARCFTMKPVNICRRHGVVACVLCAKDAALPANKDKVLFDVVNLSGVGTDTVVVIDSLSQVSSSSFNQLTRSLASLENLDRKYYGAQGQQLDALLTAIQQAPFHVAVISHEAEIEYADGKKKLAPVGGTKNFSTKVPKYFDHVVYTTLYNGSFKAASSASYNIKIMAGSRSDLAMESGKCSLSDLLKASPIAGAMSGDDAAKKAAIVESVEAAETAAPLAGASN
jgi:hypothetical protein